MMQRAGLLRRAKQALNARVSRAPVIADGHGPDQATDHRRSGER
jgi:hypothetical protein